MLPQIIPRTDCAEMCGLFFEYKKFFWNPIIQKMHLKWEKIA